MTKCTLQIDISLLTLSSVSLFRDVDEKEEKPKKKKKEKKQEDDEKKEEKSDGDVAPAGASRKRSRRGETPAEGLFPFIRAAWSHDAELQALPSDESVDEPSGDGAASSENSEDDGLSVLLLSLFDVSEEAPEPAAKKPKMDIKPEEEEDADFDM